MIYKIYLNTLTKLGIMRQLARKILWKFYKPIKPIELNQPIFYQLRSLPKNRLRRIIYGIISRDYEQKANERVVEMPFVFQNISLKKGASILDFGCTDSKLPIELASLGYKVTGTDLRSYKLRHPNFNFVMGYFQKNSFRDASFDAVTAISAIEHCGMSDYGEEKFEQGDYKIVKEINRILKPKGQFIITVPFGMKARAPGYRIYDLKSLHELLRDFRIKKEEFYIGLNQKSWVPSTDEELEKTDSATRGYVQGVACVLAEKR